MYKFQLAVKKNGTIMKVGNFDTYDDAVDFLHHLPKPEGIAIEIIEVGEVTLALRAYDKYRAFVGLDD